ncbi:uncharacterized protein MELLADRAFT_69972 [Melampsora larici-populina 98AG31]|uniref:Alpha-type protein kinase domain-containing protein n=1 Tax=Melampsora larici-populina (strain 98AG31 / pathotype 3-4-7) TaxID=747676 RepID=F4SD03_MELLP|nr:uncharacterized protein MELLADRAFT_69972 [Melampsora larici-populina 98AG31]EGF97468.1 hypothetical protein MELLADRAFT_69972 [Melampsora larici-populina 98AG31]
MPKLIEHGHYANHPELMKGLSPRDIRRLRQNFVAPQISAAAAREVLGEEELPKPAFNHDSSWLFTLKATTVGDIAEFSFVSKKINIDINLALGQFVRYWDWASTFTAQINQIDSGRLEVEVQSFGSDSERSHFMLCQEKYHTAMLLNLFKGKLKEISSLLTLAKAQLATDVRFAENHVLAHRNTVGQLDMYTLQERLPGPLHRTSDTSYSPSKGNVPMLDFLNTFTHYTYWRTNNAAVINGFHYVGCTIFYSLIVDKNYKWHAGYYGGRISDFEKEHRCNSLCTRMGMKQPARS